MTIKDTQNVKIKNSGLREPSGPKSKNDQNFHAFDHDIFEKKCEFFEVEIFLAMSPLISLLHYSEEKSEKTLLVQNLTTQTFVSLFSLYL